MRHFDRQYMSLIRELATAQFKLTHQEAYLGFLWSFLHPLLILTCFYVMFSARFSSEIENFPVYLLIGIVHVTHFSSTTASGLHTLRKMRGFTTNTLFPKETLVIGSVVAGTVEFVVSLGICVLIAIMVGTSMGLSLLLLPLVVVLQFVLTIWVSLLLSCCAVFVFDLGYVYQIFLRLLLFVTPVFYTLSFIGEGLPRTVIQINPLTHLMNLSRRLLIQGDGSLSSAILWFILINAVLIVVSLAVFRTLEPRFAEEL